MKNQEDKIEQEIQKTLSSIDRHQRLEANPYLYEKVKERISDQSNDGRFHLFFANKIQPALFVALLLVNIYVAYGMVNSTNSSEDFMETLAEEYDLENTDLSSYNLSE